MDMASIGASESTAGLDTFSPGADSPLFGDSRAPTPNGDDIRPDAEDTGPDATVGLSEDTPWHPAAGGSRALLALSAKRAAWVETDLASGKVALMTMAFDGHGPPMAIVLPPATSPRELSLGDDWLVYVDDRYGDEDIFAVDLSTGTAFEVARRPGVQRSPHVHGPWVVWEDCRLCPAGSVANQEIYLMHLPTQKEERMTTNDSADREPALGDFANGDLGIAWIEGYDHVRKRTLEGDEDGFVAEQTVGSVALVQGVLVWRPSATILNPDSMKPGILNPDSMLPSDVFLTQDSPPETTTLTVHAELLSSLDGSPSGGAGRVAWLESTDAPPEGSLHVANVMTKEITHTLAAEAMSEVSLGDTLFGFIAPSDANNGENDVWIYEFQEHDNDP